MASVWRVGEAAWIVFEMKDGTILLNRPETTRFRNPINCSLIKRMYTMEVEDIWEKITQGDFPLDRIYIL